MGNEKKNRSYILQSVVSKNGSWNSDFNHSPKQYGDQFFASDRALKFAVRSLLEQMGKNVLIKKWAKGIKSGKTSEFDVMTSKELKDDIKDKFGKDFSEVFWEFEDVRQFGMVYDGLGIHGVAQISQGLDLYNQGIVYNDDLTGRMVFSSKSDSSKETRGMASREHLSEGHFVYDISVNPWNVKFLQEIEGYEDCKYTEDDYGTLLECLEHGPRNIKSTQKTNCYTGFMMKIDLNDGVKNHLGDLQSKLSILPEKEEGKTVYDVSGLFKFLKQKEENAGDIYKSISINYESSDIILRGMDEALDKVSVNTY